MAGLTHALDPSILGSKYGQRKLWVQRGNKWVQIDDFHVGLDVKLGGGSPLPAMADGVIVEVSHSSVRGYMIAVDHGDGTGHRWHQVSATGRLAVGTRVKAGQTIARVGHAKEMGTGGKGEHGHLEYRTGGRIKGETAPRANTPDPVNYMEEDMAEYKDWSQESKEMLQRDIWYMGLGGIPNAQGDKVGARDILAGAEREATKAATRAGWAADYGKVPGTKPDGTPDGVPVGGQAAYIVDQLSGAAVDAAAVAKNLMADPAFLAAIRPDYAALAKAVNDDAARRLAQ